MALRVMPHGGRQEWVADEKGFFTGEGLEYTFVTGGDYGVHGARRDGAGQIRTGAFETFEAGRDGANVSASTCGRSAPASASCSCPTPGRCSPATRQWTQARNLFPEQRFTVAYDDAALV